MFFRDLLNQGQSVGRIFFQQLTVVKVADSCVGGGMAGVRLHFLQRLSQFQRQRDGSVSQIVCGDIQADCFAETYNYIVYSLAAHFFAKCAET